MNNYFEKTFKYTAIPFFALFVSLTAQADNVKLVNKPLVESSTSDVLPNLMYILDNSGSMNQNYTPDWIEGANFEEVNNGTELRIVNFTKPILSENSAFNTQFYNPAIRYTPAANFDGSSMPEQTVWTNVRNDAFADFYNGTSTIPFQELSTNFINSASSTYQKPDYYSFVAGEYCTTAALNDCITSNAKTTTHTFPAPLRWCTSSAIATSATPAANTCRSVREGTYVNLRTPSSTTTFRFANASSSGSNNTVNGITVNGRQIMSGAVIASTAANLATQVRNAINACTNNALNLNCQISGHSASVTGTNPAVLTIVSPWGSAAPPAVMTRSGGTSAARSIIINSDNSLAPVSSPAFTVRTPGSLVYTEIVSTNNVYPIRDDSDDRTDCSASSCTYNQEMTNYANWWTYYRTRMQGMKTSTSLAFKPIDNRYRVGFITINNPSSNYLAIAKYEGGISQQKDRWYTRLFSTEPGGGTPLRQALSMVGRIYANKNVGFTTGDPVQYACQANFSLLTTDGYWNGNGGTDVNNEPIGNLDDGEEIPRPLREGGAAVGTLADVAKYYYDTDIRNNSGSDNNLKFNNCNGALGQDVCGDSDETIKKQNMTTLTLGLGIDGTLIYSSDYKTQEEGDFADIKSPSGIKEWPVPVQNTASAIDDLWHAAVNANGTYFSARTPKELSDSLKKALSDIQSKVGAGSAASASSLQPTAGDNFNYVASYATVKWIGNLEARTVDLTTFETRKSATWCAENVEADAVQGILPCDGTMASKVGKDADTRDIKFNSGGTLTRFEYNNLNGAQKKYFEEPALALLNQWPSIVQEGKESLAVGNGIVNYLRGQQGFEIRPDNETKLFRSREKTLGDITESQPAFISKPIFTYTDAGYQAFKTEQSAGAGRAGRIYVGANDGMLHAFNSTNGNEVWAFVPTPVIPKMAKLADDSYSTNHVNFVNGDPTIAEVCVATAAVCSATATKDDWRTVLVGGLSGGGRGYYALDITDPNTPKLLWEFTAQNNANLGYTFGSPVITKLADGRWVALLTSGYNNGTKDYDITRKLPKTSDYAYGSFQDELNQQPGDGRGYLYVVDIKTGLEIKKFSTGQGGTETPSGLAQISAFVDDISKNNLATYVYGGDLLGNLWRFNLNAATNTAPLKLATLIGSDGSTPQPITTAPQLGVINKKRVVFVGTGKYLELADLNPTAQKQSLYAIKDTDTALGDPRPSLIEQVINKSTRVATKYDVNFDTNLGWFVDFPDDGERMNIEPFLVNGVLLAPTIVPKSTSCSPGGYGWFNFFNYKTGSSLLASGLVSEKLNSPAVGFNLVYNAQGKPVVSVVESSNPTPHTIENKDIASGTGSNRTTLFNKNPDGTYGRKSIWRELVR